MLLDLYMAHHEQREVYLWPLCMAANTPLSTAHRKIGEMERRGLVVRDMTARDRRRIGVRMTDEGLSKITSLLDRIDAICHGSSGTAAK
jgi:DNA-binding MarR family transcriptional regulator